ncbi:MAG: DinB family protein [Dehalococcoidia bacterium]
MSELDELTEKLTSQRQELLSCLEQLDDQQAGQRPAQSEWCAKEQLAHLVQMEQRWVDWALQVRDNPGCTVSAGTGNPEGYPEAAAGSLSDLLRQLADTRQDTLRVIRGLGPEELQRKGRHTEFGEMSVLQMLRAPYRHDRMHLEQIQGKEVTFRPRQG